MRVCGVDDAGRGPVIGPLVVAGIAVEERKIDGLRMLRGHREVEAGCCLRGLVGY